DHISMVVRNLEAATGFSEAWLGAIGYAKLEARPATVGFGKKYPEFWINLRTTMAPIAADSGAHVGLRVRSAELVDAFHAAALAGGGGSQSAPRPPPPPGPGLYPALIPRPPRHRLPTVAVP